MARERAHDPKPRRSFVRWAGQHGHLPPVDFPYRVANTIPVISQQQRLEHIRNLLTPRAGLPAAESIAGLFLLYAQPITRVAQMRLEQSEDTGERLTVSFTGDRLEIPPPFDGIVRAHLKALPNTNTSAHLGNKWLFPGVQPGKHMHQGRS